MKLVHLDDMTYQHWQRMRDIMYSPELATEMGIPESIVANAPTLEQYYSNIRDAYDAGRFQAWGIVERGEFLGHVILDKRAGEWELAVVIEPHEARNKGYGVKAGLHAMRWAFEEDDSEWVIAVAEVGNENVGDMLKRMGFRKLSRMWVMDSATWRSRWGRPDTQEE